MTIHRANPLSTELVVDDKFQRSYVSVFQVITSFDESPYDIGDADELPEWGDTYKWNSHEDKWAIAKNFSIKRKKEVKYNDEDAIVWHVTVKYDTKFTERENKRTQDPVDEPLLISGSYSNFNAVVLRDRNNRPIANTSHQLIEGVNRTRGHDTISIQCNTDEIDLLQRAQAINSVNSIPMWGLDRRQVKLVRWTWKIGFTKEKEYIANNFEFLISYQEHPITVHGDPVVRGWYLTQPNKGTEELFWKDPEETDPIPDQDPRVDDLDEDLDRMQITDKPGVIVPEPVFLDIKGGPINASTYIRYEIEPEYNFLTIPRIPDPLPGPFIT